MSKSKSCETCDRNGNNCLYESCNLGGGTVDHYLPNAKLIRQEMEDLLNGYYNYLMDNFDGHASEEAIDMFLDEKLGGIKIDGQHAD